MRLPRPLTERGGLLLIACEVVDCYFYVQLPAQLILAYSSVPITLVRHSMSPGDIKTKVCGFWPNRTIAKNSFPLNSPICQYILVLLGAALATRPGPAHLLHSTRPNKKRVANHDQPYGEKWAACGQGTCGFY